MSTSSPPPSNSSSTRFCSSYDLAGSLQTSILESNPVQVVTTLDTPSEQMLHKIKSFVQSSSESYPNGIQRIFLYRIGESDSNEISPILLLRIKHVISSCRMCTAELLVRPALVDSSLILKINTLADSLLAIVSFSGREDEVSFVVYSYCYLLLTFGNV